MHRYRHIDYTELSARPFVVLRGTKKVSQRLSVIGGRAKNEMQVKQEQTDDWNL